MKTDLPYRYQEILTALADYPDGLTTAEIHQRCRSKPGSELPDSTITWQCIFGMRRTGYVITTSPPDGHNLHQATDKGREALASALGADAGHRQPPEPDAPDPQDPNPKPDDDAEMPDPSACLEPAPDDDAINLLTSFDSAVAIIRSVLEDNLAAPQRVKIRDKAGKIAVLQNIKAALVWLTDDGYIAHTLDEIRADLDRFEEETEG